MKKDLLLVTLALLWIVSGEAMSQAQPEPAQVTVGIVIDGDREDNDEMLALVRDEIHALVRGEFNVVLPENKTLVADWSADGVRSSIDQLLADVDVTMVLGLGPISSDCLCSLDSLPKPAVASFVINDALQGIPFNGISSGVHNLNYIVMPHDICSSIGTFRDVVEFDNITFLVPKAVLEAIPELTANLDQCPASHGLDLRTVAVATSSEEALAAIEDDADAVFVGVMLEMPEGEFELLVEGLNARRLPTFALAGETDVEKGLLAGYGEGLGLPLIARRIAINVQRILLGEDPGAIPVSVSRRDRLLFNMGTARRIGVSPSWKTLTEAVVINEARSGVSRMVDLPGAISEALEANLDLATRERYVAARAHAVGRARSALLPNVELSATGVVIDEDRAEASFGNQAERTMTGTVTLSQVLFSEQAWADLSIQKDLRSSREYELEQLRLDIVLDAATAYLNLLRAKTYERIQKDNLSLTRANLEIAQTRQRLGVSGPGEVYRWEAELASNRRSVVEAQAERNAAEIALNRLLNRPAEEPFLTAELDISTYLDMTDRELFNTYVGDKAAFRTFREFAVDESLRMSPELRRLDKAIEAQERAHVSAKRAFWMPSLFLQGEASRTLSEAGAGTSGGLAQLLSPGSQMALPEDDDVNWSLGLRMTYPLFAGGRRLSAAGEAHEDLKGRRLERDAVAERVEQQVRSALHYAGASWASIDFTRCAAEAAGKNLELVADAYSRGAVSVVDLLDAQNAALVSDLVAANAISQFLIDLMAAQRAMGRFYSFAPEDERRAAIDRLEKYFDEHASSH